MPQLKYLTISDFCIIIFADPHADNEGYLK